MSIPVCLIAKDGYPGIGVPNDATPEQRAFIEAWMQTFLKPTKWPVQSGVTSSTPDAFAPAEAEGASPSRTPSETPKEAQQVARTADLFQSQPAHSATVVQAAGGFWVSTSPDAINYPPFGLQVPENGPWQRHACSDLDEVVAVLKGRFG